MGRLEVGPVTGPGSPPLLLWRASFLYLSDAKKLTQTTEKQDLINFVNVKCTLNHLMTMTLFSPMILQCNVLTRTPCL